MYKTVLLSLLLVSLIGCGSAPTAPVLTVVHLPDGSEIVANGGSEFSFVQPTGGGTAFDNRVLVNGGEILIISLLPAGYWFTGTNPLGFIAHVTAAPTTPGAIMRLNYDLATGKFIVDCIQGICETGPDAQRLTTIPWGNQGDLDQSGNFQGPSALDIYKINGIYAVYIQLGLTAPTSVGATPTEPQSQTPTPDLPATATYACQQFESQYPATPCP